MSLEHGRIVTWDRAKGFGYVETSGHRVFLHIRDFAEHHKYPEIGDVIVFSPGADARGRPCAKQAVHFNDGGAIRRTHLLFLALLLVAPALAIARFAGRPAFWFLAQAYVGASILCYLIYAWDKKQARLQGWRERESLLHLFELAGGWPGAFLAQRRLHHKSSKLSFQFVFWLIVGVHQFVAVDSLAGWPLSRAAVRALRTALANVQSG